eukprot:4694044-Pleurochrysis_carterae.AAC.5
MARVLIAPGAEDVRSVHAFCDCCDSAYALFAPTWAGWSFCCGQMGWAMLSCPWGKHVCMTIEGNRRKLAHGHEGPGHGQWLPVLRYAAGAARSQDMHAHATRRGSGKLHSLPLEQQANWPPAGAPLGLCALPRALSERSSCSASGPGASPTLLGEGRRARPQEGVPLSREPGRIRELIGP